MRVSRLHAPISALGFGLRAGIWLQGCSIACPGCVSLDAWDPLAGGDLSIAQMGDWLEGLPGRLDGVTISGGEPTDQPDELSLLLDRIRAAEAARGERWDILVYTGRAWPAAQRRCGALAVRADAVVAGPYRKDEPTTNPLMGSANQTVVSLTELGGERYGAGRIELTPATVDLVVDDENLWLVGIPRQGEMERLRAELVARGVRLRAASWLS